MEKFEYDEMYGLESSYWWFRGKRMMIRSMLRRFSSGGSILDIGCGTGIIMKELSEFGDVHGIDMSKDAIDFCKKRGLKNLTLTSVEDMDAKAGGYDVIILSDVLEHVKDDAAVVKKVHGMLKPGGIMLVTVPALMSLWSSDDVTLHHYRRYSLREVRALLHDFRIVKSSYFNFFVFPGAWLVRKYDNYKNSGSSERKLRYSFKSRNILSRAVNKLLFFAMVVENFIMRAVALPVGVDVICVARKE